MAFSRLPLVQELCSVGTRGPCGNGGLISFVNGAEDKDMPLPPAFPSDLMTRCSSTCGPRHACKLPGGCSHGEGK